MIKGFNGLCESEHFNTPRGSLWVSDVSGVSSAGDPGQGGMRLPALSDSPESGVEW